MLFYSLLQNSLEALVNVVPDSSLKNVLRTVQRYVTLFIRTHNIKLAINIDKNEYQVFELDDFLTDEHCDSIVGNAKEKGLIDSPIVDDRGMQVIDIEIRQSKQAWLVDSGNISVQQFSERVEALTGLPRSHQEDLQVVSYSPSGFYRHHYDASFHPEVLRRMNNGCGPRVYTLLVYLNDDFEGGETEFMILKKKVLPKKGKAIFFQNLDDALDLIPESLHAGMPVTKGTKWIANKWIRVWPFELHNKCAAAKNRENVFQNALSNAKWFNTYVYKWWFHSQVSYSTTARVLLSNLYHNMMCHNWPLNRKSDFDIIEIDNFIHADMCGKIGADSERLLVDMDIILSNNIQNLLPLPVDDRKGCEEPLIIVSNDSKECKSISPYIKRKAMTPDGKYGIPMASVYIFLNDDYSGGQFEFPQINKTVVPRKGKMLLCVHIDQAMVFDAASVAHIHPVVDGVQRFVKKEIYVMNRNFVSALQKSMKGEPIMA